MTRYTVVYIKNDGQWLQSAVRDEVAHDLTPHDRLKELEWLVGEWINESQDAIVQTTCKWADDGNFLIREFTMKTHGQPVLSGTQRIGWDPVRGQFKTWIFDTEGGFGEGYWTRNGDQWVIKAEGVRQDGRHASVDQHHHATGQGPGELAVGRPDHRRRRGARGRRVHHRAQATRGRQVTACHRSEPSYLLKDSLHESHPLETGPRHLSGVLALPSDVFAGRGGGRGGGGGGRSRGGMGGNPLVQPATPADE